MKSEQTLKKLTAAIEKDNTIAVHPNEINSSNGQDPRYLEYLGLSKSDLIRLSRIKRAIKARYATQNPCKHSPLTGPHRIRWILTTEALDGNGSL